MKAFAGTIHSLGKADRSAFVARPGPWPHFGGVELGAAKEPQQSVPLESRGVLTGPTVSFLLEIEIQISVGPKVVLISFTAQKHGYLPMFYLQTLFQEQPAGLVYRADLG